MYGIVPGKGDSSAKVSISQPHPEGVIPIKISIRIIPSGCSIPEYNKCRPEDLRDEGSQFVINRNLRESNFSA